jgi:hypothetical protein
MGLRRPEPPKPPKPEPPKPRWWRRWFRRNTVGARAVQSDAVVAARLGRTVTIATGLITALVGITGTITTAVLSYENAARQLAAENDRSVAEFLRTQRQTTYAAFIDQARTTEKAFVDFSGLFGRSNPNSSDYAALSTNYFNEYDKFGTSFNRVQLIASRPVRAASHYMMDVVGDDWYHRVEGARAYFVEGKPADDYYKLIPITQDELNNFGSLGSAFLNAAADELESTEVHR